MATFGRKAKSKKRAADHEAIGRSPTAGQSLTGVSARFVLLVIGLVIVAGYVLAPRRSEQMAMLADAHRPAELIALLEQRLASGDQDPALPASLSRAHEAAGNYRQAADYLERYGKTRPPGSELLAKLAELYEKAGDQPKYRETLERLVATAPTFARAAALSEVYFRDGRVDDARTLLSRYQRELTVKNGLLFRLAELHVAANAKDDAIAVLSRTASGFRWWRRGNDDRERFLLAELLVQTGRSAQAAKLGKRWVAEWREAWHAGKLLRIVAATGSAAEASALADTVVAFHPEIRLYLVHEMLMSAPSVARHLLTTWGAAQTNPTSADFAAFLTACRELRDPAIIWQNFADALAARRPDRLIMGFGEAIAAEFGIQALAPFWPALPKRLTWRRPLLTARLMFDAQNIPLTKYFLSRVDLARLETSDQPIWFDLLSAVAEPRDVLDALRTQKAGGHLSPDLLARYALLSGAYGHHEDLQAALADLAIDGK
jgi:tetratricopeptide (TPR) repeat protein